MVFKSLLARSGRAGASQIWTSGTSSEKGRQSSPRPFESLGFKPDRWV